MSQLQQHAFNFSDQKTKSVSFQQVQKLIKYPHQWDLLYELVKANQATIFTTSNDYFVNQMVASCAERNNIKLLQLCLQQMPHIASYRYIDTFIKDTIQAFDIMWPKVHDNRTILLSAYLHKLARYGSINILKRIYEMDASVIMKHAPVTSNKSILFTAIEYHRIHVVQWLLELGFTDCVPTGKSALTFALHVYGWDTNIVQLVLQHNKTRDYYPLQHAIVKQDEEHYKLMLCKHKYNRNKVQCLLLRYASVAFMKLVDYPVASYSAKFITSALQNSVEMMEYAIAKFKWTPQQIHPYLQCAVRNTELIQWLVLKFQVPIENTPILHLALRNNSALTAWLYTLPNIDKLVHYYDKQLGHAANHANTTQDFMRLVGTHDALVTRCRYHIATHVANSPPTPCLHNWLNQGVVLYTTWRSQYYIPHELQLIEEKYPQLQRIVFVVDNKVCSILCEPEKIRTIAERRFVPHGCDLSLKMQSTNKYIVKWLPWPLFKKQGVPKQMTNIVFIF